MSNYEKQKLRKLSAITVTIYELSYSPIWNICIFENIYANYQHTDSLNICNIYIKIKHTYRALIWCIAQYGRISISYQKPSIYTGIKQSKMSDSLNANLILSYFPCSDFPGLLVCDEGDFREMHTTKIDSVADTSTFFTNVTGLLLLHLQ